MLKYVENCLNLNFIPFSFLAGNIYLDGKICLELL